MDELGQTPDRRGNGAGKTRGRPFEPGESGNPNGRPKGHRNKATVICEELLDGEAQALTRKAIDKALDGDMVALRLCLERLLPPRRDRLVTFELPKFETADDALKAISAIALPTPAAGELSPSEAADITGSVSTYIRTYELTELRRGSSAWRRKGCRNHEHASASRPTGSPEQKHAQAVRRRFRNCRTRSPLSEGAKSELDNSRQGCKTRDHRRSPLSYTAESAGAIPRRGPRARPGSPHPLPPRGRALGSNCHFRCFLAVFSADIEVDVTPPEWRCSGGRRASSCSHVSSPQTRRTNPISLNEIKGWSACRWIFGIPISGRRRPWVRNRSVSMAMIRRGRRAAGLRERSGSRACAQAPD